MLCYDCIQEPKVQKRKKYRRKQTAKQKNPTGRMKEEKRGGMQKL